MENSIIISIVSGLFGLVGIVVATFVGYRQTKITANSADQQTNISGVSTAIEGLDVLAKQQAVELERVKKEHKDFAAECSADKVNFSNQIAHQAGQIEVLKTIPLTNIDTTLQSIDKFSRAQADTTKLVLETLKTSAIAAEVVKSTLAKDTEAAAHKVEDVKTDLKVDDQNLTRKVKNGD